MYDGKRRLQCRFEPSLRRFYVILASTVPVGNKTCRSHIVCLITVQRCRWRKAHHKILGATWSREGIIPAMTPELTHGTYTSQLYGEIARNYAKRVRAREIWIPECSGATRCIYSSASVPVCISQAYWLSIIRKCQMVKYLCDVAN